MNPRLVTRPRRRVGSWRTAVATAALLLAATAVSWGHDTWLAVSSAAVPVGARVTLDLTSGMSFPALEYAIRGDRVHRAAVRLAGRTTRMASQPAPRSLRFTARLRAAGVAAAWVELAPKTLVLTDSLVAEYLDEIGAADSVRERWAGVPAPRWWVERYAKHAKTFVRVGEPAGDSSWATPVGMALEIVPASDPTRLRAGDTLAVRVLKEGAPLAGFVLNAARAGLPAGKSTTTDAVGRAWVVVDAPGRWLVRGTELRPAAGSAGSTMRWASDFTTLTLVVAAR